MRRGRWKAVCARGSYPALACGRSASPLDGMSHALLWLSRRSSLSVLGPSVDLGGLLGWLPPYFRSTPVASAGPWRSYCLNVYLWLPVSHNLRVSFPTFKRQESPHFGRFVDGAGCGLRRLTHCFPSHAWGPSDLASGALGGSACGPYLLTVLHCNSCSRRSTSRPWRV